MKISVLGRIGLFIPDILLEKLRDIRCALRVNAFVKYFPFKINHGSRYIFVSPHPDDETFGCGGLIRKLSNECIPLKIIFITSGELVADELGVSKSELAEVRKAAAYRSCQILGVNEKDIFWLNFTDGSVPNRDDLCFEYAVSTVLSHIDIFEPTDIYCPHPGDMHSDHVATCAIVNSAIRKYTGSINLYYYAIWMWYLGSHGLRKRLDFSKAWRLDISSELVSKEQSIDHYLNVKTPDGRTYVGDLPRGFLKIFRRPYEIYFGPI